MMRRLAQRCVIYHTGGLRRCTIEIKVPIIAESITEGKIVSWLKKVGDSVEEDEIIVQVESEKSTVDVRAPTHGSITGLLKGDGALVKVGELLATVKKGSAPSSPTAEKIVVKADEERKIPEIRPPTITVAVVESKPADTSKSAVQGADPRVRHLRLSAIRKRIAERLKASQNTAAMLTTFNEIDMTPLIQLREKHKDAFAAKHGVKLGFMSPFVKACALSLMDVPVINASFGNEALEYHDFVDISVAVATATGLIVPVLRDVQSMSLAQIEKKIEDFGVRAKENKIRPAEMTGGTFTISNGGTFGSWMGTPIINPPQSAILGMHATKKKPWVVDNQIVIRDIMAVALTYDHRLIDGRDAVTFLVKVKNLIEDPMRMLLDL